MVSPFRMASGPEIIFGSGSLSQLPRYLQAYGPWILILTGKSSFLSGPHWTQLERALKKLGINWAQVSIDREPGPLVIDQIVNDHRDSVLDAVVAIGGGSVLDAGKAVAAMLCHKGSVKRYLEGVGGEKPSGERLPFIAIPTTAGTGSEASKNAVITQGGPEGFKKSLRHDNYVPELALIDPQLALNSPPEITAASGMDAFTQLLEAYLSTKASPMTDALALEGLEAVAKGLKKAVHDPNLIEARTEMAYAALLSGICLANAGLGLVHGFASSLGGSIDIPHGVLCARLMGSVNRLSLEKLLESEEGGIALGKYAQVGKIFSQDREASREDSAKFLVEKIEEYIDDFEIPKFAKFGLKDDMLRAVVEKTSPKNHPVSVSEEEKHRLLAESI